MAKDAARAPFSEGAATQAFLGSDAGVTFLIDKAKDARAHARGRARSFDAAVDEVVDFYATWAAKCPTRHGDSQYALVRRIEDHCAKADVRRFFEYLF